MDARNAEDVGGWIGAVSNALSGVARRVMRSEEVSWTVSTSRRDADSQDRGQFSRASARRCRFREFY